MAIWLRREADLRADCNSNLPGRPYCATQKFSQSTLRTFVTGYDCSASPETNTAYDYYTSGGRTFTSGVAGRSIASGDVVTSSTRGFSTTPFSTTSSPDSTDTPTPPEPIQSPTPKRGISGGAIAGIVIGALAALLIALGMFLLYRYKKNRHPHNQGQAETATKISDNSTTFSSPSFPPAGGTTSPSSTSQPQFMTQTPSTHTPLTHAALSDISPHESASQVGGGGGSHLSYNNPAQHAQHHQSFSTNNESQSGVGSLPQFQNQHPGLYQGGQGGPQSSVMTPGSAFGSMPPAPAPGVPSPSPPPLQQQQMHHGGQAPMGGATWAGHSGRPAEMGP